MARVVEGKGAYEGKRGKGEGSWALPFNPEYAEAYCYSRTPRGTRTTQKYKQGAAASAKMLVTWLSVASKSESDSTLE